MKFFIVVSLLLVTVFGCDETIVVDDNVADDSSVVTSTTDDNHRLVTDQRQRSAQITRHRCADLRLFHEELQRRRLKNLCDHILSSLNLNKPPSGNISRPSEAMLEKIRVGSSMQMQSDSSLLNSLRTNKTPQNHHRQYAKHASSMTTMTTAEIRKKVLFSTKGNVDYFVSLIAFEMKT